jgi:hypothetical protein
MYTTTGGEGSEQARVLIILIVLIVVIVLIVRFRPVSQFRPHLAVEGAA